MSNIFLAGMVKSSDFALVALCETEFGHVAAQVQIVDKWPTIANRSEKNGSGASGWMTDSHRHYPPESSGLPSHGLNRRFSENP